MLNLNLKPAVRYVKFVESGKNHGKLEISVKIYDEPVAQTGNHTIFSLAEILEEDKSQFGIYMYEAVLNESEVNELFANIIADPMKFKNR